MLTFPAFCHVAAAFPIGRERGKKRGAGKLSRTVHQQKDAKMPLDFTRRLDSPEDSDGSFGRDYITITLTFCCCVE